MLCVIDLCGDDAPIVSFDEELEAISPPIQRQILDVALQIVSVETDES